MEPGQGDECVSCVSAAHRLTYVKIPLLLSLLGPTCPLVDFLFHVCLTPSSGMLRLSYFRKQKQNLSLAPHFSPATSLLLLLAKPVGDLAICDVYSLTRAKRCIARKCLPSSWLASPAWLLTGWLPSWEWAWWIGRRAVCRVIHPTQVWWHMHVIPLRRVLSLRPAYTVEQDCPTPPKKTKPLCDRTHL